MRKRGFAELAPHEFACFLIRFRNMIHVGRTLEQRRGKAENMRCGVVIGRQLRNGNIRGSRKIYFGLDYFYDLHTSICVCLLCVHVVVCGMFVGICGMCGCSRRVCRRLRQGCG